GTEGDLVMLGPPLVVSDSEVDEMGEVTGQAVEAAPSCSEGHGLGHLNMRGSPPAPQPHRPTPKCPRGRGSPPAPAGPPAPSFHGRGVPQLWDHAGSGGGTSGEGARGAGKAA